MSQVIEITEIPTEQGRCARSAVSRRSAGCAGRRRDTARGTSSASLEARTVVVSESVAPPTRRLGALGAWLAATAHRQSLVDGYVLRDPRLFIA